MFEAPQFLTSHNIMEFKLLLIFTACLAEAFQQIQADCTEAEQTACQLPDCLCPGVKIPGGLDAKNIPQIVYLTFDDAVNAQTYPIYQELFPYENPRTNPDGQPITLSFYVTHEYTDYSFVHQLWRHGHDIALHSITHQTNTQYWKDLSGEEWKAEIVDQKEMLAYFARIPASSVTGMRAPFLQTGGDTMMAQIAGELAYDCSRPTQNYVNPGLWPYTADYDTRYQDCQIQPCAVEAYPGFWNVPMVDLTGGDGYPCAMIDSCQPGPNTTEQTLGLIKQNFERHYNGNRAPFGVFTHAAWLLDEDRDRKGGYKLFLDYLATLPDVFIVSVARGLEWIKKPTTMDAINDFAPWKVEVQDDTCVNKYTCRFPPEDTPGFPSERYMTSCESCPRKYPWLHNPFGDDIRANKFQRN